MLKPKRNLPRALRSFWVAVYFAIFALQFTAPFISPAFAIDERFLHQQSGENDKTHQVQAHPIQPRADLSFFDRYAPPQNITTLNGRIDWLFRYTSWTASVFFLIMAGSLIYFIIANRERPGHTAYYTHGTSKANGLVTRLLDVSVFISLDLVLIAASFRDTRDIVWAYPDPTKEDVIEIMVMPQQWAWNFKYPGADGKFGTADDITLINDLRVPVGKKVLLQIKSKDVIHGFMIPNLRIQVDALPGVVTRMWFDALKVGDYEMACYHHCGTSHYKMKAFFTVMEQADYKAWAAEQSEWAKAMYDADDKFVHWGWNWDPAVSKPVATNIGAPAQPSAFPSANNAGDGPNKSETGATQIPADEQPGAADAAKPAGVPAMPKPE